MKTTRKSARTPGRTGPLHERIRSDLESRIVSGHWQPGDRIPCERELTDSYGCSRMTVHKALSALARSGLIVRRRRAGSFVGRPHVQTAVLAIPDLEAEIARRNANYGFRLLARRVRTARAAGRTDGDFAPGSRLLDVRCLHLADAVPFASEERLISLSAVPDAAHVDFSATPPGAWLLHHVPWTEAEHRISAIGATRSLSRDLQVSAGTPCLALERRTWQDGRCVTVVRQTFPGESLALGARFSPGAR